MTDYDSDVVILLGSSEDGNEVSDNQRRSSLPSPTVSSNASVHIVFAASIFAAVGGLLFGYDVGIISGALLQLKVLMVLSCFQQQMIICSMLIGALVMSCCAGFIIDYFGRKQAIIINSIIFVIGAVALSLSKTYYSLIMGRIIIGLAVSLSAISECIYISEIAPPKKRGMLVSLNELGITLGFLIAYIINYLFADVSNGWRYMFGISAIPAFIQGIAMMFFPSSPHCYLLRHKEEKAEKVLKMLRGENDVRQELANLRFTLEAEKNESCWKLCSNEDGLRSRMFIAIGLVFFQQFTGQPNVLYYASTIFQLVGYCTNRSATQATVILGVIKFLATCCSVLIVDRIGRRKLLMFGSFFMMISIASLGIVIKVLPGNFVAEPCKEQHIPMTLRPHNADFSVSNTFLNATQLENANRTRNNTELKNPFSAHNFLHESGVYQETQLHSMNVVAVEKLHSEAFLKTGDLENSEFHLIPHFTVSSIIDDYVPNNNDDYYVNITSFAKNVSVKDQSCAVESNLNLFQKWLSLASLLVFVAAYSVGFGPVTWLLLSEIFPVAIKGRAVSVATIFNWAMNTIISMTFLDMMDVIGIGETFLLYSAISLCSFVFVFLFVPETKNLSLHRLSKELRSNSLSKRMWQNILKVSCFQLNLRRGGVSDYRPVTSQQQETTFGPTETTI